MAMGQAAGVAAALSAKTGMEPATINVQELREKLIEIGAVLS
jgi:hypothetical protein